MARWTFAVALDPASPVALYDQIARALCDDIRRSRLRPGDALPGTRALAATLGVHRNTVVTAYATLAAEGWTSARPGSATRVADTIPLGDKRSRAAMVDRGSAGFELSRAAADPEEGDAIRGLLRVSDGVPDPRDAPVVALGRALRAAVRGRASSVFGYGDPAGDPALRAGVAAMLGEARGLAVTADEVVITAGSQGAIDLVARALLRPGDRVAVERVGYRPAWEAFRAAGATLVPLPVDAEGIDTDALARALDGGALRAVYVTPQHQYPTTVTLSAPRRLALLSLARRHRFAVLEDDYDHEFHFDGRPVLPLASADAGGLVVYVGTFSKVVAPGLRAGWLVAPGPLRREVVRLRTIAGRQGDGAVQAALAALLDDGVLQRHVRRMRRTLHARRDAAVDAVRRILGRALAVDAPGGGMTLWARSDPALDLLAWQRAARDRGVHLRIGRDFDLDGRALHAVRLGYGQFDEQGFLRALRTLARALPSRRGG